MAEYTKREEQELKRFLREISKIDDYLRNSIAKFDEYYQALEKFEEKILFLVYKERRPKKIKRSDTLKLKDLKRIKEHVRGLAEQIFPKFREIMQREVIYSEQDAKLVQREIQTGPVKEEIFTDKYKGILKAIRQGIPGEQLKKKLIEELGYIKSEIAKEKEEVKIDEEIKAKIQNLREILQSLRYELEREASYLNTYLELQDTDFDPRTGDLIPPKHHELKDTEDILENSYYDIRRLLNREYEEFIKPLYNLLSRKDRIEDIVERYEDIGKITPQMIKKDSLLINREEEWMHYQNLVTLYLTKLDTARTRRILKYLSLMGEKYRKKKKEEEKKLKGLLEKSKLDTLTGLPHKDRGAKEEFLFPVINRNKFFSVVMFDIDFFKGVNDTYSHQVGDEVLKEVVRIIEEVMRKGDLFMRWGGEEFMIVLNEERKSKAAEIAERIREKVANETVKFFETKNKEYAQEVEKTLGGVKFRKIFNEILVRLNDPEINKLLGKSFKKALNYFLENGDKYFEAANEILKRESVVEKREGMGFRYRITLSLGVAEYPKDYPAKAGETVGNKADGIIGVADKKLYVAKQTGRNKVFA
ncbi:diguanylate cyclase [Candidatus Woesearchaeota archaeon]|nr:diguanylate cyclase [Candidatus Woesearchaeota archaeon]